MSLIEAIILGVIQGLTEFLPVSSSGHIELGKAIFGIEIKEGLLFTIVLHFATALSTIVVFRKDILQLFKGLLQFKNNEETRFSFFIVISMIPAVLVGLTMKDQIDVLFESNVLFVCLMLIVTGVILYISDKLNDGGNKVNTKNAVVLGIVQAIAILPGISRSGSTIASAVILKISREKAARFSFLMVLPVIIGAMLVEVKDAFGAVPGQSPFDNISMAPVVVGFLAAFISGYFACVWMIQLVKKSKLRYFSYYCWLVAIIGIAYSLI